MMAAKRRPHTEQAINRAVRAEGGAKPVRASNSARRYTETYKLTWPVSPIQFKPPMNEPVTFPKHKSCRKRWDLELNQ